MCALPRGEVQEPDRHADHLAVDLHDVCEDVRTVGEQRSAQRVRVCLDRIRFSLVLREFGDESQQQGQVGGDGRTHEHGYRGYAAAGDVRSAPHRR